MIKTRVQGKDEMPRSCDLCGRGPQFGHHVSHAKNRTPRTWSLNLHRALVTIGGHERRMRICSRCLRSLGRGVSVEKLMA